MWQNSPYSRCVHRSRAKEEKYGFNDVSKYQPTTGKFKTILYGSIWVKCGTKLGNRFILSGLSLNGDFISKIDFYIYTLL